MANGLFKCQWKLHDENSQLIDLDTLPDKRNIREKLNLIEAETLSNAVSEISKAKESEDRAITHAIDSTTKKRVGQFATQGIHIGRNVPFPLPLIGIAGETTEDIALQVDFGMEVLAAVQGKYAKEVYKLVDVHMTDSVGHNKGLAAVLADIYDLDQPAGQIFCGSHTTLGFSNALNKRVSAIEADMKVEQVLSKFMVGMELDSKNGSLAGQSIDMMLKLVAPEYSHKMWNYYKLFVSYLEQKGVPVTLFSYKDQRFGCLSRASAVLLYNMPYLVQFLSSNPHINNRLACLVRELLELPYLKVVFVVFAAVGVHIIEPFYCKTIDKESTHSSLRDYYALLYSDLGKAANESFFNLEGPVFESVSTTLFDGVAASYGEAVISSVREAAKENISDTLTLLNICLPELRTVLARQRRDYGLSEDFPAEYPVFQQTKNIDDTPVNNLAMERQCGTVDYRLKKLQTLPAVSRSLILSRAEELQGGKKSNFRSFKAAVEAKQRIELEWQQKTKEKFAAGAEEKQLVAQLKERKRLDMMDQLKAGGGPFTDAEQVQEYLDRPGQSEKEKQARLKKELQFARESSTTLPSVDPLFRIQVTLPNKKRRDKTASEFGESLMAFLGKKAESAAMEYNLFKSSLRKFSQDSDSNNN